MIVLVDRLLPYLHMDSSPSTFINYINGLSNLPTRIMMSPIIYEEFYASRYKTSDFEVWFLFFPCYLQIYDFI